MMDSRLRLLSFVACALLGVLGFSIYVTMNSDESPKESVASGDTQEVKQLIDKDDPKHRRGPLKNSSSELGSSESQPKTSLLSTTKGIRDGSGRSLFRRMHHKYRRQKSELNPCSIGENQEAKEIQREIKTTNEIIDLQLLEERLESPLNEDG